MTSTALPGSASDAGAKKEKANFGSLGRLNITSPEIKAECPISGEMDQYNMLPCT
jgi:hypothetical protein